MALTSGILYPYFHSCQNSKKTQPKQNSTFTFISSGVLLLLFVNLILFDSDAVLLKLLFSHFDNLIYVFFSVITHHEIYKFTYLIMVAEDVGRRLCYVWQADAVVWRHWDAIVGHHETVQQGWLVLENNTAVSLSIFFSFQTFHCRFVILLKWALLRYSCAHQYNLIPDQYNLISLQICYFVIISTAITFVRATVFFSFQTLHCRFVISLLWAPLRHSCAHQYYLLRDFSLHICYFVIMSTATTAIRPSVSSPSMLCIVELLFCNNENCYHRNARISILLLLNIQLMIYLEHCLLWALFIVSTVISVNLMLSNI